MYADRMSPAMEEAISETNRRRAIQMAYNEEHNITPPTTIIKAIHDMLEREQHEQHEIQKHDLELLKGGYNLLSATDRKNYIKALEKEMLEAAKNLEFERAAVIRDEIQDVKTGKFTG